MKHGQCNDHNKNKTNNDLQNTTKNTQERATRMKLPMGLNPGPSEM